MVKIMVKTMVSSMFKVIGLFFGSLKLFNQIIKIVFNVFNVFNELSDIICFICARMSEQYRSKTQLVLYLVIEREIL